MSLALPVRPPVTLYRGAFRLAVALFAVAAVAGGVRGVQQRAVLNLGATIEAEDALAAGELDRAGRQFEIVTRVTPGDSSAWRGLGDVRMRQQRPSEAIRPYEQAIASGLSDAALHSNLGVAYGLAGRYEAAARQFARAAELDPRDQRARNNLGWALAEHARTQAGGSR